MFALDETSDKPKENRIVKFHDEAPERGRSAKKSKSKGKSRSLVRTSTSILKDTSGSVVNLGPEARLGKEDGAEAEAGSGVAELQLGKKKEKKRKRGKAEAVTTGGAQLAAAGDKALGPGSAAAGSAVSSPAGVTFPLNLSTEESGYESDLTRKTSSKVVTIIFSFLLHIVSPATKWRVDNSYLLQGSDSSVSNSPASNRSQPVSTNNAEDAGLELSPGHGQRLQFAKSSYLASDMNNNNVSEVLTDKSSPIIINNHSDKKDLEQRDVSLESITTNNGTIVSSYLSCSTAPAPLSSLEPGDEESAAAAAHQPKNGADESSPDQFIAASACEGADLETLAVDTSSNKTDEEKLTGATTTNTTNTTINSAATAALLSEEQQLTADSPSPVAAPSPGPQLIEACGAQQSLNENVTGDRNDECAISLIDLKGPMTAEESENAPPPVPASVKADYNIECEEFPATESFPIHTNKTDINNENMQTNSPAEDAGVVPAPDPAAAADAAAETFHNGAENHSDTKISASAAEIKSRSAHEDVESPEHRRRKTGADEDRVMEKLSGSEVGGEGDGGDSGAGGQHVTSLEVEWLQHTLALPWHRGLNTDQAMAASWGRHHPLHKHVKLQPGADTDTDTQTSLPIDFGESLPPRLTGLVNKQFRMVRLVKEAGMELGVLITKKFNKDKRTTGYIIAYIEPHGLVHR